MRARLMTTASRIAATLAAMLETLEDYPDPEMQPRPNRARTTPGEGSRRAEMRHAMKLHANRSIPDTPALTRQQRRAAERAKAKRLKA